MKCNKQDKKVIITLSDEESLVLFDWLVRFNEKDNNFQDQSEERILFDLESGLEETISQVFSHNYRSLLEQARSKIKD